MSYLTIELLPPSYFINNYKITFMKIIFSFLLMMVLFQINSTAQSSPVDKNKLMDFFQNQQFDEAINYMLPIETNDSTNIILLGYLGYAYYMNDNIALAKKYYQSIFNLDSTNVSALQYLTIFNKSENTDLAIAYTRRLISLQPNKAVHYRTMAELFRKINKRDSVFLYYKIAYNIAPKEYKNAVGFADILVDKEKFTSADSIIKAALLLDSNNIPLLKVSMRSFYNADDYKAVLAPGEKLIRLDEPALSSMTQLFLSYYTLKLYPDCIRVCDYLIAKGYLIENVLFYQAKSWAKLKDFNKSNELLNTCLSLAISKLAEMYHYSLGLNYEEMKQYKKAITNYDTAYYLFKNPVMNYNSGRIAETDLKNNSLAQKYYTEYLKKANPTEADEKKAYLYVKERWGKKKNNVR